MSLKIYNPSSQNGTNACALNRGNCSHLCFPISTSERVCACAAGYTKDSQDPTKCHGKFNFYYMIVNKYNVVVCLSFTMFYFLKIYISPYIISLQLLVLQVLFSL